jgi:hypothetical protein
VSGPAPVQLQGTPSSNTTASYQNDGNNYLLEHLSVW